MGEYRTIVADPPWQVKRPNGWHATLNSIPQPRPTLDPRLRLDEETQNDEGLPSTRT